MSENIKSNIKSNILDKLIIPGTSQAGGYITNSNEKYDKEMEFVHTLVKKFSRWAVNKRTTTNILDMLNSTYREMFSDNFSDPVRSLLFQKSLHQFCTSKS